tara:strand:- start:268 stop:501 length:234 start_codon:yes stop_codon:yes gene_type:complete
VFLENLNFKEMESLSKFDSSILAAALVFVVVELMVLEEKGEEPSVPFNQMLSEASAHALDLVEGVHLITNTGEETLH